MSLPAKTSAWDILPSEWPTICQEMRQPAFRAKQILTGLYQDFAESWEHVTTLPADLRKTLADRFPLTPLSPVEVSGAEDGVSKLLLSCADGERVETVIIPSKGRVTQCVSSQIGCAFGCAFCASGSRGLARDLSAGEIVAQVMAVCRILRENAAPAETSPRPGAKPALPRPGNIVVMGMGEPFANYDSVMRGLRILNHQQGLNIGARHITISTCGLVPGIRRLAGEGLQFELSVSLHAPDDELRGRIMPVNRRWHLAELIETCREYTEKTGRLVTFEYTLIKNLNDRPEHAARLIRLLRHMPCKVNLIPLSPVEGFDGRRPDHADCLAFLDALLKARIKTTMRRSRGKDVNAACGQLRIRSQPKYKP